MQKSEQIDMATDYWIALKLLCSRGPAELPFTCTNCRTHICRGEICERIRGEWASGQGQIITCGPCLLRGASLRDRLLHPKGSG